jgi:hypothetical protein
MVDNRNLQVNTIRPVNITTAHLPITLILYNGTEITFATFYV